MRDDLSREIERFEIEIRHGLTKGRLVLRELCDYFKAMKPSLHRYADDPRVVDLDSLIYATQRLPEGMHTVRKVLVRASVPEGFASLPGVRPLTTRARRRAAFRIDEHEIVIVGLEGFSDVLDLVSLLTSYVIEAEKIRVKLDGSELKATLSAAAASGEVSPEARNRLRIKLAFELGTDEETLARLEEAWSGHLVSSMLSIATFPHDITMHFHPELLRAETKDMAAMWLDRIEAVLASRGYDDRPIHLISSNTHSPVNCLSPYARQMMPEIMAWAKEDPSRLPDPEMAERLLAKGPRWENALYFAMRAYLRAFPEAAKDKLARETAIGIDLVKDTLPTGIDCQLVDVAALDLDEVDDRLRLNREVIATSKPIIINIDYAFGDQGEKIMGELLKTFKERIKSVSIMGKAGTVVGERGGIMLPSYFLRQGSNDVYDFPFPNALERADVEPQVNTKVYDGGPMLTVHGTILQNEPMLRAYKEKWGILGLEMEGIPYVKKLKQCKMLGRAAPGLIFNVGYYASDAPLNPGETLARNLSGEGLDATYGLTIAILNNILA